MKVGDSLEIPALNETRKVKSIQMFRVSQTKALLVNCQIMILVQVSVDKIHGGDRAGICVTQFDPKLLERGLVRPTNNILTLFQFSFLGLHTWKCSQHLGSSCLNGKDSIFQGRGLQNKQKGQKFNTKLSTGEKQGKIPHISGTRDSAGQADTLAWWSQQQFCQGHL